MKRREDRPYLKSGLPSYCSFCIADGSISNTSRLLYFLKETLATANAENTVAFHKQPACIIEGYRSLERRENSVGSFWPTPKRGRRISVIQVAWFSGPKVRVDMLCAERCAANSAGKGREK
jgi:hypothetical protein